VAVTAATGQGALNRNDGRIRQYVAFLPRTEITRVAGLPVTTPARTVTDCLRHLDAYDAVPIADAALRAGLTTVEEVRRILGRQSGWPFAGVAALALPLLEGRRESPLESRSAVVMHRHRLPAPRCQATILDAAGRFVARTDFAWLELGVVGEADGRGKYAEQPPVEAFEAEKARQARLEELGLVVVRWERATSWATSR
jgi:hypothetical protein